MVSNSKKRDDFTENTEWCGLLIDSYKDRENDLAFYVTPTGSKNDKVIMGVTIWRYLARNDETDIYPPRDLSTGSSFRPSLTQRFSFEGIENKSPIHITPYTLGGLQRSNYLPDDSQKYEVSEVLKKEVGVDAKIGLGSNVTLDLSVNTDFSQIEVDNQQKNLTRSNIFFPEKRLIFQERASLFNFNFGLSDRLFHSRRVGIVNGRHTRIYGGARIIGKFGKWEFGGLTMQTASQGSLESENFGVIRIRRNIFNENSTIGLIATNRTDLESTYNRVLGLDANVRVYKENFVSLKWARSFVNVNETQNNNQPTKLFIGLSKRSQEGLTYTVNFSKAGKDYEPGIGFETREDFSQLNSTISYNFFPHHKSKISQYGPYVNSVNIWNNTSGNLESQNVNLGFQLLTKLGWTYNIFLNVDKESLNSLLYLPGRLEINPGNYSFNGINGINGSISSSSAKKIAYTISAGMGGFYNGQKTTVAVSSFVNISPDFSIQGSFHFNHLKFSLMNKTENIILSSVNMLYTLSTKLTFSSLVQHNNLSKSFIVNLRVRYNPKEVNDFYLVLNGDINQDLYRVTPRLPISNTQTLFLKYSHTFHL